MRIYIKITEDIFRAYALENSDGSCDIEDFLDTSNATDQKDASSRRVMYERLERLVEQKLPTTPGIHHNIDDGIWQISSGKYRLMYFFDKGHIVICTHWFAKQGQKTPRGEIKKARRHREEYFEAKKNNTLSLER